MTWYARGAPHLDLRPFLAWEYEIGARAAALFSTVHYRAAHPNSHYLVGVAVQERLAV